ncbi:MAG: RHS repeat-associated core domain-containing protein [Clostridia bacterium]|nr:RHS repeat-associated core domain-containing protein [Clostridia bacterium]
MEYIYHKNIFGDIVAIYQGATKVAEYAYDAYGRNFIKVDIDGIATSNPFRYRGYYWDSDLSLYYLMSRYYDPATSRFINTDSLEYLDPESIHGLNLFAYCGNNPVMYADPSGHFGIVLTLLITTGIGLLFGLASGVVEQASKGKDFWDLSTWNWDPTTWNWWEIGKSSLIGAASGFAYGLGGVAGGIIKGSFQALSLAGKVLTVSQSVGVLLGIAAATNFAAGVTGYVLSMAGSNEENFSLSKAILEGVGQMCKGIISFLTGGIYSASGVWNVGERAQNGLSSIVIRSVAKFVFNFLPNLVVDLLF